MTLRQPPFDLRNSRPGIYGYDESRLTNLRSGIGRVMAGTGRMKIGFIGNSETLGAYGGAAGSSNKANTITAYLRAFLNLQGIPAQDDSVWGNGNLTMTDSRTVYGAGWTGVGAANAQVGCQSWGNSTNTNTIAFTPRDANTDTFDVWFIQYASFGVFSIDDGTHTKTATQSGAGSLVKISLGPGDGVVRGANTFNIKRTGAGNPITYIVGWEAYDSTTPKVALWNWGSSGSTSTDWNNSANVWSQIPSFATFAPDHFHAMFTINDASAGTANATYQSNLNAILSGAQAVGSITCGCSPYASNATVATTTQNSYAQQLFSVAAQLGIPALDLHEKWVSYTSANAQSIMYDATHPNGAGYYKLALSLYDLFLNG